jgi:hypothetical protein
MTKDFTFRLLQKQTSLQNPDFPLIMPSFPKTTGKLPAYCREILVDVFVQCSRTSRTDGLLERSTAFLVAGKLPRQSSNLFSLPG